MTNKCIGVNSNRKFLKHTAEATAKLMQDSNEMHFAIRNKRDMYKWFVQYFLILGPGGVTPSAQ